MQHTSDAANDPELCPVCFFSIPGPGGDGLMRAIRTRRSTKIGIARFSQTISAGGGYRPKNYPTSFVFPVVFHCAYLGHGITHRHNNKRTGSIKPTFFVGKDVEVLE